MEKIIRFIVLFLALLMTFGLSGCGGGGSDGGSSPTPQTGDLNITIVDGTTAEGIAEARVILLDAESEPLQTYVTDANGIASQSELLIGDYQLKISAQGYNSSPPPRVPPLPVKIYTNQTTDVTIELYPIDPNRIVGAISGKLTWRNNPVAGALVIADGVQDSYTTISDADGSYVLYNVEEGSADVTAYIKRLNFPILSPVNVTANTTTTDQDLIASGETDLEISGNVNFVAGGITQTTDITLVDLVTREVIPGMRVYTDANNYTMKGLPNGNFEIIASMLNDGNVIDPDEAVTQGDPLVIVTDIDGVEPPERDFKITGAVVMDTPATPVNNEVPVLTATPTFTWHSESSYSSASGFAIEVINENGETVWGGFGVLGPIEGTPSVTVPGGTYTIDYAGPALQSGRYYQLRIYAMKDVTNDAFYPNDYKLISVTENLDGVFKVE